MHHLPCLVPRRPAIAYLNAPVDRIEHHRPALGQCVKTCRPWDYAADPGINVNLTTRLQSSLSQLPVLQRHALRKAREAFIANREDNLFFGIHETWDQAAAEALKFGKVGYDNNASAAIYDHRTRIDTYDYPALYWLLRSIHEGRRHVGDVGGSIGIKFLAFRDALSPWPDLRWTVHDVPAAISHGRELSASRGDGDRLKFADRFEQLQDVEILYTSGVLQYLPETLAETLAKWQKRPQRIIINTTPIHPTESYFTVNSIGTAFCPYRIQTQAALIRDLTRLGYKLRESWINPDKRMTIPMHPEHSLGHYSGYCLDRTG